MALGSKTLRGRSQISIWTFHQVLNLREAVTIVQIVPVKEDKWWINGTEHGVPKASSLLNLSIVPTSAT